MNGRHSDPRAKIFYKPIEAALLWCELTQFEAQILAANEDSPFKLAKLFPQWPCLHSNLERIVDAIQCRELPYGQLGIPVPMGTPVECSLMTIRHTDLRYWMKRYYPNQRPRFLFEHSESKRLVRIDSFLALQADREALQLRLNKVEADYQELLSNLQSIGLERDELKQLLQSRGTVSRRSEFTFLRIIGALIGLMLERSPSGKPFSVFNSQASIVAALLAHYENVPGITKRTLDEKFAAAKRSLNTQ
ncbi:hypothetical protein J3P89_16300 [Pseudomonas sp. Z1-14]|uniref:hypothetical protein n=1 Tax=Pseudomonas sp. Z1-14 TaxID=2817409 RepID=UPI003DA9E144